MRSTLLKNLPEGVVLPEGETPCRYGVQQAAGDLERPRRLTAFVVHERQAGGDLGEGAATREPLAAHVRRLHEPRERCDREPPAAVGNVVVRHPEGDARGGE